jgi:polyisoprenoid-binding protein YceI
MTDISLIPGYLAGTWTADPAKSTIAFSVRQLMIGKARGRFTGHDVTIVTGDDPLASTVTATIDAASIDTGNPKRDAHLCTAAFLDVANHPTVSYRSTGIRPAGDGWIIDGELRLHGVTRAVPLAVTVHAFVPDPHGAVRANFSATGHLDRGDFGIDGWSGGGAMVGDKVSIKLEIEAVRKN